MSSLAIAEVPSLAVARPPSRSVLWAIALVGCVAGASSIGFAVTNEEIGQELGEPLVISALFTWTTLAYILGGLLAWSQRPASRFGPLMITAGGICFLVTLSWTDHDLSYSLGQLLDKLPAVLFLH